MKESLKNLFKFGKTDRNWKSKFTNNFYSNSHHQWIVNNSNVKRCFDALFEAIPEKYQSFFVGNKLIFLQASGKISCALSQVPNQNLILIYPDLYKLMNSAAWHQSCAVLAHEVGHVFYHHGLKNIDPLDAQIEADHFAYTLGFGDDLQNFLLDYEHSLECKVRISRLTQKIILSKFNG
jgi:hypothetical protein